MSSYNRDKQRGYDNQAPEDSSERDEWIAERAEAIAYQRISDLTKVAAALDDMGGFGELSDIGTTGSTLLSEIVARIVTTDPHDTRAALAELDEAVRHYLLRDAETDAAAEYDAQHLPRNFKGEE